MQGKAKAAKLHLVAGIDEKRHELREAYRTARPYLAGALVTAMVAGAGITSAFRFGGKEDMAANALLIAFPAGAKAYKHVQRNSAGISRLKRLELHKISAIEQEDVARSGLFDDMSALLNNIHIAPAALTIIRADESFKRTLREYMQNARENLNQMEGMLFADPTNSFYKETINDINKHIGFYEHNERVLFEDSYMPKARDHLKLVA